MARPSKKAVSKAQEASKALDRIFAEVDPNLIIAGFLGGTAAAGGLVPPFTRLLSITSSVTSQDYDRLSAIALTFGYGPGGVLPGLFRLYMGEQERQGNAVPTDAAVAQYALFCSGALEGMLMYKAFSTQGLLEAVITQPAKIVDAIVPG